MPGLTRGGLVQELVPAGGFLQRLYSVCTFLGQLVPQLLGAPCKMTALFSRPLISKVGTLACLPVCTLHRSALFEEQ